MSSNTMRYPLVASATAFRAGGGLGCCLGGLALRANSSSVVIRSLVDMLNTGWNVNWHSEREVALNTAHRSEGHVTRPGPWDRSGTRPARAYHAFSASQVAVWRATCKTAMEVAAKRGLTTADRR